MEMSGIGSPSGNPQANLLVVDDDPVSLRLLSEILLAHGYRVRRATSGAMALEALAAEPADMVLLDVRMPDLDGYEVCRRLKRDPANLRLPILFISGLSGTEDKLKGFQCGGLDFILKPFRAEEVVVRVATHLRLAQLTGHLEQLVEERCEQLTRANLALQADIAERQEVERALRIKDWAVRSARDGFATADLEGRMTSANPAFLRMWGFTAEAEVLGLPTTQFWELGDRAAQVRATVLAEGYWSGAMVAVRKDGSRFDAHMAGSLVRDDQGRPVCLQATFTDLTEEQRTQKALQESEARFRAIFDESAVGLWLEDFSEAKRGMELLRAQGVTDLEAHLAGHPEVVLELAGKVQILAINAAGAAMMGADPGGPSCLNLPAYLTNPSALAAFGRELAALDAGVLTYQVEAPRQDLRGQTRWFDLYVTVLPTNLAPLSRVLLTLLDLTQRKEAEREHAELEARLHQAQKMESLGNLAGGVAHDMNNVLGAIMALASAHLKIQPEGSQVRQAFETINQAAVRGGDMVKGLLTFARRTPAQEQDVALNQLVREAVQLLARTTLAQVRLHLELTEDLPLIRGDGNALAHTLMNLCVNAVDAMAGQGELTLRTQTLADGWVQLQVRDTGAGMSQEVLARALDPYFTTKPEGKGTGLGLSMAYSTVTAHHGSMNLESEPGQGTCVTLSFPATQPGLAGPAAPDPAPGAASGGLQVLLVDDDELIQSSTRMLLELMGHSVRVCSDGEAALVSLAQLGRPNVVILDLNMPGLGGAGTLPRLRALCPDLPVLLATGRTDQSALDVLEANSGVGLLAKPFSMDELQAALAAIPRTGSAPA